MQLIEATRPSCVRYQGEGIVAGSRLSLEMRFQIAAAAEVAEVRWQGDFSLDGMLALMAGDLIETMGLRNFNLMAERLQNSLRETTASSPAELTAGQFRPDLDFDI